jgi:AraC-like protein
MLLVDTSQYSVKDRGELIRDEFSDPASGYFAPADGDDLMKMRFRTWDMGDGCSLLNLQSSGLLIGMRPPRLSSAQSPIIGFALNLNGTSPMRFSQDDRREIVPGGTMYIAEMSEAFTLRSGTDSEAINLRIPLEVLDMPLRDVRKAAQWLPRSPLYELARQHLLALSRYTEEFGAPHPSAQQAALHVLRALIKSFSTD